MQRCHWGSNESKCIFCIDTFLSTSSNVPENWQRKKSVSFQWQSSIAIANGLQLGALGFETPI